MDSKVYYKVQFCTDFTDWTDIPKVFSDISVAENYALELCTSKLISSRVCRVYEIVLNEYSHDV